MSVTKKTPAYAVVTPENYVAMDTYTTRLYIFDRESGAIHHSRGNIVRPVYIYSEVDHTFAKNLERLVRQLKEYNDVCNRVGGDIEVQMEVVDKEKECLAKLFKLLGDV